MRIVSLLPSATEMAYALGLGVICGVQQAPGGGGRIALIARAPGGLAFTGALNADAGLHPFSWCGEPGQTGSIELYESSDAIPTIDLISGVESFDQLSVSGPGDGVLLDSFTVQMR